MVRNTHQCQQCGTDGRIRPDHNNVPSFYSETQGLYCTYGDQGQYFGNHRAEPTHRGDTVTTKTHTIDAKARLAQYAGENPNSVVRGIDKALAADFYSVWIRLGYAERAWCDQYVNESMPLIRAVWDGYVSSLTVAGWESLNDALDYTRTRFMIPA